MPRAPKTKKTNRGLNKLTEPQCIVPMRQDADYSTLRRIYPKLHFVKSFQLSTVALLTIAIVPLSALAAEPRVASMVVESLDVACDELKSHRGVELKGPWYIRAGLGPEDVFGASSLNFVLVQDFHSGWFFKAC